MTDYYAHHDGITNLWEEFKRGPDSPNGLKRLPPREQWRLFADWAEECYDIRVPWKPWFKAVMG